MDIKETVEVLDGAAELIIQYKAAMADGKIGLTDIPKIVPVFNALKSAIDGMAKVPAELKDLDEAEVVVLFQKISALISEIASLIQVQE